jgi:hypothetical protein
MPAVFNNIYQDFLELNSARSNNGYGPNPISFSEIQAFYSLNRIQPEPWEVFMIRYFDAVIIKLHDEDQAKKAK